MGSIEAKLIESWAKSPFMNGADVLIMGECVRNSYSDIFKEFSKGRVVLTVCPEAEQPIFGKLASMLTSTKPRSITVLTVDCSPDCYTLHAGVNEAYYISDIDVPREHFVILNGKTIKISPEAIRLSRYLSLTQKAIENDPTLIEGINKHSLEHKAVKR